MDEKKKFKIEFDDDFDSWLAQHEQATKDLKPPTPPVQPETAVSAESAFVPPTQPESAPAMHPAFVPPQFAPSSPVQSEPAVPKAPFQPDFDKSAQVGNTIPAQPAAKASETVAPGTKSQSELDPQQFKSVASNSGSDVYIKRSDAVKNFKVEIKDEDYNRPAYVEPEQPIKRDKSVYFAGRKPSKPQLDDRAALEKALEAKKMREKRAVAEQRKKENKQVNRLRRFLIFFVIIICSLSAATYGISCMNDIIALKRSTELVQVNIEKGAGYEEIIDTLGENGLIKHKWFCKLVCKFRGFDTKEYLYGVHYLTPSMGVEGMLTEMLATQTSDKTIRLSFPEGWSLPQIVSKLEAEGVCPAEYIYTALEEMEFDYDFIDSIPEDGARCYALEGYFFPDTYDFFVSDKQNGIGENPTSILNKLLGNFESRWSEVYTKRAKELDLTMDEVMIIASIIQKEAADKSQMGVVSSVIHNRLKNSTSYPLLECNSTKDYVTNNIVPVLGDAGASAYVTAYDTYNSAGLPPGPICNPGIDAIEAALNPDDTNYLYFCHNEAGKIYVAKTYSQHQSNWAQVLKDNEAN